MEKIRDIASKLYEIIEDKEIYALGTVWEADDIKNLIQYDALKLCALVYLFSDEDERQVIEEGLSKFFDYTKPERCVAKVLEEINIKSLFLELYGNLPYSVALAYSEKSNKDSEAGFYLSVLETIVLAIVAPGGKIAADIRLALIAAYFECCENKLKTRDITCGDKVNVHIANLESFIEDCETPSSYEDIQYLDEDVAKKIFDKLKGTIEDGTLSNLVKDSVGKEPDVDLARKKLNSVIEFVNDVDHRSELADRLYDAIFSSIRVTVSSSFDEDDDEDDENYEDDDEDEDDGYYYDDDDDIEDLLKKLYSQEGVVNEIFGDEISIVSGSYNDPDSKETLCKGDMFKCLRMAYDKRKEIRGNRRLFIVYAGYEHSIYSISSTIEDVERKVEEHFRQIEYRRLSELKLDESVLPEQYAHFSTKEVNESNFDILFQELKKIEKRYSKGLYSVEDNDYYYYSGINDWESECCYEQAKFIENLVWTGGSVAYEDLASSYTTIRKCNKRQLKYYLYWRTNFFNGTILKNENSHLFLCMYELVAEMGDFSKQERVKMLERLIEADQQEYDQSGGAYGNYRYFTRKCVSAISDYEKIFNLINQEALFSGDVTTWRHEWDYCAKEIIDRDYTHLFEVMNRQSQYHPYSGALNTRIPCADYMIACIKHCAPHLDNLLVEHGFSLSEVLVGEVVPFEKMKITQAVIWTDRVQNRLFGNEKSDAFVSSYGYGTYPLAEYVLKVVENAFRKYFKTGGALKASRPMYYDDNYAQENYSYYQNNVTPEEKARRKKYLDLFDKIDEVLATRIEEYFEINATPLMDLKIQYVKPSASSSSPSVPYVKKVPAEELMVEFINSSDDSEGQVEKLIDIYNEASPTTKKTKAKKFSCWMWDFWLLHESEVSYRQLDEIVQFNKWNIDGVKALQERKFVEALSYLRTFYDPCAGVISKKIDSNVIADSIIITFLCVDRICSSKGIDFTELLLGKFDTYDWIIYDTDEQLKNKTSNAVIKNIGNVQIYQFDPERNISLVKRHSYSQDAKDFLIYLLKNIDNHFRVLVGHNSLLNNVFDKAKLADIEGASDVLPIIDDIIAAVTKFVADYNNPMYQASEPNTDIEITDAQDRDYSFVSCEEITDISLFVEDRIKEYYGIVGDVEIKANRPYDVFEIDLDNFDIHDWLYRYKARERIKQNQTSMLLYRFYDIYGDITNRLMTVKNNTVEYDSSYNFLISKVLKDAKGLINKDLNALSVLGDDATDFMQWIEWAKRGKFVYSKNEPYVQILFHFILNDWILSDNRAACLVMMCEIWNYYFKDKEKLDSGSDLYLEWIKDYWMLYCSDKITYEEFRSLFIYDIEFYNTNGRIIANEHFFVDMDRFDETHLLQFYNENCDYHVMEGTVVRSGYKSLLEDALEEVHGSLKTLWSKYGLNFIDFFHMDEETPVDKTREVFYRAILTGSTKRNIARAADRITVSDTEMYVCEYDYDRAWPVFKYQIKEISNASSRSFMEYILKLTEKGVREWLNMPYNFKFDEKKLFEAFPNRLFSDNAKGFIIESTVMDTVIRVCSNSGIKTKNPKMLDAQIATAAAIEEAAEGRTDAELELFAQNLGFMKGAANSRQAEFDLIERDQKVDKDSIERARRVLKKNQERLVIDEEISGEDKHEESEAAGLLTTDEKDFLRVLLDDGDVRAKISEFESRFVSVSLLIESINNKAIDEIGDMIIEEDDEPYLVEDYLDEARELLEK